MQPTTREMQAMAAAAAAGAGQISLDDLRNGHAGATANAGGGGGGVHDDFLDQMLSCLPPSAWPDLAAGKAAEDDAEGMHQQQQFVGPYDESAMLASRLRQHQISGGGGVGGGGGAAAVKQMVLQQLADLRQGHHMMLQGLGGRSPAGGGSDGGLLLPLTLGSGGSGGDVQALLKAATANSAGGDAGGVYGGFAGSLHQQQQHFQPHPQVHGADDADAELRRRRRRRNRLRRRRGAGAGRRGRRRRAGAAAAAGARAARPGHRPPQHRRAASEGEDRREDEGPARTGSQRQQDGQGVDAGRDHRLRQVPTTPSQGFEHEPVRWRRCRRAARGRHVLGGARRRGERRSTAGGGGERQPDSDGAAGGQADGGGHGHRHAVPAGEGPLPHAHIPRVCHLLGDVPSPAPGGRRRRPAIPGRARRRRAPPPTERGRGGHARAPARPERRRLRAGLAEHVGAHGAVGYGQRRRGRRRRGVAAQGRRLRLQAVNRGPPPSLTNGETLDGVGVNGVSGWSRYFTRSTARICREKVGPQGWAHTLSRGPTGLWTTCGCSEGAPPFSFSFLFLLSVTIISYLSFFLLNIYLACCLI